MIKTCNYNQKKTEPCICFYCREKTCENVGCNKCINEKNSFEKPCCSCSGFIKPLLDEIGIKEGTNNET